MVFTKIKSISPLVFVLTLIGCNTTSTTTSSSGFRKIATIPSLNILKCQNPKSHFTFYGVPTKYYDSTWDAKLVYDTLVGCYYPFADQEDFHSILQRDSNLIVMLTHKQYSNGDKDTSEAPGWRVGGDYYLSAGREIGRDSSTEYFNSTNSRPDSSIQIQKYFIAKIGPRPSRASDLVRFILGKGFSIYGNPILGFTDIYVSE